MKFEVLTLLHTSDSCRLHFHLDVPLKKGVLVPAERRFEQVRVLREDEVNVLVVGSDEFFAHFEGLRGRVRRVMVVRNEKRIAEIRDALSVAL